MLVIHKPKCEFHDMNTFRTSSESHLLRKNRFHKNPIFFKIFADFETVNEIDKTSIGEKTTNFFEKNQVLDGYNIVSESNDVLKTGYYESPLGCDNVDWYVNEVMKLENKMKFYFKNTKKNIIMTEQDEEDFKNNNICRFSEKNLESDKVGDHCHLTGKTEDQLITLVKIMLQRTKVILFNLCFTILLTMIVIYFLKKLLEKMNDKVKFDSVPKTN